MATNEFKQIKLDPSPTGPSLESTLRKYGYKDYTFDWVREAFQSNGTRLLSWYCRDRAFNIIIVLNHNLTHLDLVEEATEAFVDYLLETYFPVLDQGGVPTIAEKITPVTGSRRFSKRDRKILTYVKEGKAVIEDNNQYCLLSASFFDGWMRYLKDHYGFIISEATNKLK